MRLHIKIIFILDRLGLIDFVLLCITFETADLGQVIKNSGFSFGFDECKCIFTHKGTIQIVFLYEYKKNISFYEVKKNMKESL